MQSQSPDEALLEMLTEKYGGAPPFKWGVLHTWAHGGEDPLEQVYAFPSDDDVPHWHYVGCGLTDHRKVQSAFEDPESGLGFELTLRLKRRPGETQPPSWPVTRLQEIGWAILKHGMRIGYGHYLRQRKPVSGGDPPTSLIGWYVMPDIQLPLVQSASGRFGFLELVGLTDAELVRCEGGDPDGVEAALRAASPIGVTDLARS